MTLANDLQKALTSFVLLVGLAVATPAFAVSVEVHVYTPGQQPEAVVGVIVILGGVTATVNAEGVATFEDVPEGEQELHVKGRNIHHRVELVQVTEGTVIKVRANHVSALTSGGRATVGVGYSNWDADDWFINEDTKHTRFILTDAMGVVIFDQVIDEPVTNPTINVPSTVDGPLLDFTFRAAQFGGNSPWAAIYLTPMFGHVDAEISFLPDAGAPGCDCKYSGSGTQWGIGAEIVIKPDSAGRFFVSVGFSHSETETLDVNVAPGLPGVLMSAFTLEFEQNNATLIFGIDGDVVAPFVGIQQIEGDAKLTGDVTSDAFVLDPTFFLPGDTLQAIFENKFENDATLGVVGMNFRLPGKGLSGVAKWSGDSENSQFRLQAFYTFGSR